MEHSMPNLSLHTTELLFSWCRIYLSDNSSSWYEKPPSGNSVFISKRPRDIWGNLLLLRYDDQGVVSTRRAVLVTAENQGNRVGQQSHQLVILSGNVFNYNSLFSFILWLTWNCFNWLTLRKPFYCSCIMLVIFHFLRC